jgi:hypothetical protein
MGGRQMVWQSYVVIEDEPRFTRLHVLFFLFLFFLTALFIFAPVPVGTSAAGTDVHGRR